MKTLLVLFISIAAMARSVVATEGVYQKTRDEKTSVWNSEPKTGDEASWTGDRDGDGYAKGFGTLTWYSIPTASSKPVVFARYFGRMERGKLSGPVNVHVKGQTRYAIFTDGKRTTRWAAGPAPYRAFREQAALAAAKTKAEPEAPAQGPEKSEKPAKTEARSTTSEEVTRPQPNESAKSAKVADNSLQLLTGPPPVLRHELPPPPSEGPNEARLTSQEVADAGDAAVRTHGYDPGHFVRGEPKFDGQSGTWSVPYGASNNTDPDAKGFTVTIDDATKGSIFVPTK